MSIKVARRTMRIACCRGNKFLVLFALANSADDDGLYWPVFWNDADARARKSGVEEAIRSLNRSGEVIQIRTGYTIFFWIAIAFTPCELKEIAMRRFWMNDRQATVLVSEIVIRQQKSGVRL